MDYNNNIKKIINNIEKYNKNNIKLKIENNDYDYKNNTEIETNKKIINSKNKNEKEEKDLIKALKLSKAMYNVRKNKSGNFIDETTNQEKNVIKLTNINELDKQLKNTDIKLSWRKLDDNKKDLLLDRIINIEKSKNNLTDIECNNLKELLIENEKNILYDKFNETIIGYTNLICKFKDNKYIYIFNNIKTNSLISKISTKKIYKF